MYQRLAPELVRRVRARVIQQSLEVEQAQYRAYRSINPRQRLGHIWELLYAAFDFRLVERPANELTCYGCLEVKPLWCFVEKMSNRGTGLGARFAQNRMCKDCMRRYRNIEGRWYKENWVKKSDVVRKTGKRHRIRQWVFEGQSLVNPDEEVGVCANCGTGTFDLWWGCVACFEKEQKGRQDVDLMNLNRFQRKIVSVLEAWQIRAEMKERRQRRAPATRNRNWFFVSDTAWKGSFADRKAALVEWMESKGKGKGKTKNKNTSKPGEDPCHDSDSTTGRRDAHPWRALDQIPLAPSRREPRCSSCWVPNCPRRRFMLGMAFEGQLPIDRCCAHCQRDHMEREKRKLELNERKMKRINADVGGAAVVDCWLDGLERLFDE